MTNLGTGEVTITCVTDLVKLHDLGIYLTRGQKGVVSMATAMKSRDLSAAKLDGSVTVQTLRSAAVRVKENVSSDTTHSQAPRYTPPSDIANLTEAVLNLTEEVRGMRQDMDALIHRGGAQPDFSTLLAKIQDMFWAHTLAERPTVPPSPVGNQMPPPPVIASEEEVYIPSNLTGGDLKSSLNVTTHESLQPGISNAAEALKDARRRAG